MRERFKRFNFLIAKLGKYVQKVKAEEMGEFNLKGPHVSCMYYLHSVGDLTAKEIRSISGEDKAAVSRALEYLEANGFVVCETDAVKRYNSKYSLTEKGKEVSCKIAEKVNNIIAIISRGVSEENRAIMYSTLEVICFNLEEFCDKYNKID